MRAWPLVLCVLTLARASATAESDETQRKMLLEAAARQVEAPLYAVDSCGLLPVRLGGKAFARAHDFRRHLQRTLPSVLTEAPAPDPLEGVALPPLRALDEEVTRRWPRATAELLAAIIDSLKSKATSAVAACLVAAAL